MSLLRLYICFMQRYSEGVYVFYGISGGAGVDSGSMEMEMEIEKSCIDVNCVRIWASEFSLGLSLVLCLYFVNHTDDLNTDSNGSVIYGLRCVCARFIFSRPQERAR